MDKNEILHIVLQFKHDLKRELLIWFQSWKD